MERDGEHVPRWRTVLARRGILPSSSKWKTLAGGRTNRVWKVDAPGGPFVCKLFTGGRNPLYPNLPEAEYQVQKLLAGQGIAPDPVALVADGGEIMLVNRYVRGITGLGNPTQVARLLGRLPVLSEKTGLRHIAAGPTALITQTEQILRACRRLPSGLPRKLASPRVAAPQKLSLVHGDVVAGNIVLAGSGPVLIDWQCPAIGDPCEDIASYLSPAMQYLYAGEIMSPAGKAAFLNACPDPEVVRRYRALAPLYHWRMAAYCHWRAERGARDYGRALEIELAALYQSQRDEKQACRDHAQPEIPG